VTCPAVQYFPHYLTNSKIFEEKKVIEQKTRVLIFSTNVVNIIIIIIRHELDHEKPVSASSNILFTGLRSCIRPFGV